MRKNADASASYKKLDDGDWGVWTDLPDLKKGQRITVTSREGHTKLEKLTELIWKKEDGSLSLWKIEQRNES